MIIGKHLVAGQWIGSEESFQNEPTSGEALSFAVGTPALVNDAVVAAEAAFASYSLTSREERAVFLERIADEIESRGEQLTEIGSSETGLPTARLDGERGRTCGQLRLFAQHIRAGDYLDLRHDGALPDRQPMPRPELFMVQRPIGPVAVFGASNFPLAFSTAGGDTAAALAAGCPVVVKGHSAHPGTADIVAQAIDAAVKACNLDPGVFSQIQGGNRAVGQALVQHPLIKAVGFTGSLTGGRALFDLCASREEPIPFFGELGSVNPMFVLPEALQSRGDDVASGWVASLAMGAGQFCTNPGIAVLLKGSAADTFAAAATTAMQSVQPQTMLTDGIASAYEQGRDRMENASGVQPLVSAKCEKRQGAAALFKTTGAQWLADKEIGEEVFGPMGVIVEVDDAEQMLSIAKALEGQLTCTIQIDAGDADQAAGLLPVLERKAGRILANGFPTGVEVSDTMVHGGPYPASTNFGATSVGTLSIRRFLRPVCYQNLPQALLPADVKAG